MAVTITTIPEHTPAANATAQAAAVVSVVGF